MILDPNQDRKKGFKRIYVGPLRGGESSERRLIKFKKLTRDATERQLRATMAHFGNPQKDVNHPLQALWKYKYVAPSKNLRLNKSLVEDNLKSLSKRTN